MADNEGRRRRWTPSDGKLKMSQNKRDIKENNEERQEQDGVAELEGIEEVARDQPWWRDLCLALCSTRREEDR